MKLVTISVLVTCLTLSALSSADTASEKEAEKLLDLIGMEDALVQSMSTMLDMQLQQNPALSPYKQVMMEFFHKYMGYDSLKKDMVKIYSETFTASELREISEFYATDAGKKTIEKMPALMSQGGQIGAIRIQENIGELEAMIEAEAERIKELQQQ